MRQGFQNGMVDLRVVEKQLTSKYCNLKGRCKMKDWKETAGGGFMPLPAICAKG